jgi:hypothetical protein
MQRTTQPDLSAYVRACVRAESKCLYKATTVGAPAAHAAGLKGEHSGLHTLIKRRERAIARETALVHSRALESNSKRSMANEVRHATRRQRATRRQQRSTAAYWRS